MKAKITKDLSTSERKSPTIKAKKTGLLSLEDLKRSLAVLEPQFHLLLMRM